jgi:hypothetical protein
VDVAVFAGIDALLGSLNTLAALIAILFVLGYLGFVASYKASKSFTKVYNDDTFGGVKWSNDF